MAAQLLSKNSSLNHLIPLKPFFPLHYFYIFLEWSDEKREEREGGGRLYIKKMCILVDWRMISWSDFTW